jgi:hypothetical protein
MRERVQVDGSIFEMIRFQCRQISTPARAYRFLVELWPFKILNRRSRGGCMVCVPMPPDVTKILITARFGWAGMKPSHETNLSVGADRYGRPRVSHRIHWESEQSM